MRTNKRRAGDEGERIAGEYLLHHGFSIIETNYACREGEIDIIAREGETVCFVEVKRRGSLEDGLPREAVDARKQRRIIKTAIKYLYEKNLNDAPVRFDVIEVMPNGVDLIRAAFDATDFYSY